MSSVRGSLREQTITSPATARPLRGRSVTAAGFAPAPFNTAIVPSSSTKLIGDDSTTVKTYQLGDDTCYLVTN